MSSDDFSTPLFRYPVPQDLSSIDFKTFNALHDGDRMEEDPPQMSQIDPISSQNNDSGFDPSLVDDGFGGVREEPINPEYYEDDAEIDDELYPPPENAAVENQTQNEDRKQDMPSTSSKLPNFSFTSNPILAPFACVPCAYVTTSKDPIGKHLLSRINRKNILARQQKDRYKREIMQYSLALQVQAGVKNPKMSLYCRFCNSLCNGRLQYANHLKSMAHKMKLEELLKLDAETNKDFCSLCKVETRGLMDFHLKTEAHQEAYVKFMRMNGVTDCTPSSAIKREPASYDNSFEQKSSVFSRLQPRVKQEPERFFHGVKSEPRNNFRFQGNFHERTHDRAPYTGWNDRNFRNDLRVRDRAREFPDNRQSFGVINRGFQRYNQRNNGINFRNFRNDRNIRQQYHNSNGGRNNWQNEKNKPEVVNEELFQPCPLESCDPSVEQAYEVNATVENANFDFPLLNIEPPPEPPKEPPSPPAPVAPTIHPKKTIGAYISPLGADDDEPKRGFGSVGWSQGNLGERQQQRRGAYPRLFQSAPPNPYNG